MSPISSWVVLIACFLPENLGKPAVSFYSLRSSSLLTQAGNISDETIFLRSSVNLQWTLLDFIPFDKATPTNVARIIIPSLRRLVRWQKDISLEHTRDPLVWWKHSWSLERTLCMIEYSILFVFLRFIPSSADGHLGCLQFGGYYEQSFYKHLFTSLCVGICFHFSQVNT